jgi:hypothetical protein
MSRAVGKRIVRNVLVAVSLWWGVSALVIIAGAT